MAKPPNQRLLLTQSQARDLRLPAVTAVLHCYVFLPALHLLWWGKPEGSVGSTGFSCALFEESGGCGTMRTDCVYTHTMSGGDNTFQLGPMNKLESLHSHISAIVRPRRTREFKLFNRIDFFGTVHFPNVNVMVGGAFWQRSERSSRIMMEFKTFCSYCLLILVMFYLSLWFKFNAIRKKKCVPQKNWKTNDS